MSRGLVAFMNTCRQNDLSSQPEFRIGKLDSRFIVGDIFLPIASRRQDRVVAHTIAERNAAHSLHAPRCMIGRPVPWCMPSARPLIQNLVRRLVVRMAKASIAISFYM
jgi:hypothetical protein